MPADISFEKGFVQRAPRHLYQPGELVEALNTVPDQRGALVTRTGHSVFENPLPQTDLHSLYIDYDSTGTRRVYAGSGTALYRSGIQIASGLSGRRITFASMRGFGEQKLYTFAANGDSALKIKDDGTALSRWGINQPSQPPTVVATGGVLNGTYRWRYTFQRKPIIPGLVYGTYQSGVYAERTGLSLDTSTLVNGDGHIVGATQPFAEIRYDLGVNTSSGPPVWTYAYWDGTSWIVTTPTNTVENPNFVGSGWARTVFDFPTTNWRPLSLFGQSVYAMLMIATTAPVTGPAVATSVQVYDSVVAAESNPSPPSEELTLVGQNAIVSNMIDPTTATGGDADSQVTHVGVYRTVANQSMETSPFFFEGELIVQDTDTVSLLPDTGLLGVLVYDNDPPPAFSAIAEHQQRLFGLLGNQVYVSKFQQPEAFPANLPFDVGTMGEPPVHLWSDSGLLYVATAARIYQIVGFGTDAGGNALYIPQETAMPTGLGANGSVVRGEAGSYFLGADGNFWRLRGPSQGENISDGPLYQLFHGVTLNDVLPLAQSVQSVAVSGWFQSRVYFSYPTGSATTPNATLLFEEKSNTWYRDSRGFRSLFYDRQGNALYAGLTDGSVVQVASGTTDAGATITATAQTRDEDEGAYDSDKQLVQLTADVANMTCAASAVLDYGASTLALASFTVTTRTQQILPTANTTFVAKALGYKLVWTGAGALYRLTAHTLRYPYAARAVRTLTTDLGYPGTKILMDFFLDADWLAAGTIQVLLYGDSVLLQTLTYTRTSAGRQRWPRVRLVATPFRVLEVQVFSSDVTFQLWPGTKLGWMGLGIAPGIQYQAIAA